MGSGGSRFSCRCSCSGERGGCSIYRKGAAVMGKRCPFTRFPVDVMTSLGVRRFADEAAYVRELVGCAHGSVVMKGMDLGGLEVRRYVAVRVCLECATVFMAPPWPALSEAGP